ncbi:TetR/AcrR family transcriptional regulator [Hyphomicrobium sp.]|uniref:TetR/AcrR family transcriptional regulator n=1 Tax=Hyphomicrobium sp. TaxID=82 RepID=UPI0025BAD80F|nr:TetR/AcrR family transcriptional regulator [Hyphomicrobium sp.]MCC7252870.1 TetR/AcrR family transcriptional regulator [Hyphomicrobium sp.]
MTSKIGSCEKRSRGRPKSFDREVAVRAAMRLFWERGYEGSSFDDLTAAMGINASSFRNTFKSKEALYREATDAYVAMAGEWFARKLREGEDVRTAFAHLFEEAAAQYTRDDLPSGCMISLAGAHAPESLAPLKDMMAAHRASAERAMAERLKQGQKDGQIPPDANIHALAAFFNALFRGMAVQARDGATRSRLAEIANVAMQAFPAASAKRVAAGAKSKRRKHRG